MNAAAIAYVESLRLDLHPEPDYRVIRTEADFYAYAKQLKNVEPLYGADTESLPDGSPYCLTYSHTPGTGRLIYAKDKELLQLFEAEITVCGLATDEECIPLVFHNYLHDANPFDVLGLSIGKFHDTMVRSYNLCLGGGGDDDDEESRAGRGSLGLKTLAYRLLSMHMTSFKETVTPHSIKFVTKWLYEAEELFRKQEWTPKCICGCPVDLHQLKGKKAPKHTGPCSGCNHGCLKCTREPKPKPTPLDKQLDSVYTKVSNLLLSIQLDEPVDPWKRVKEWEGSYPLVVESLGPIPARSVAHVPEKQLLHYACRDADATLRLHLFLKHYHPWIFFK